MKKAKAVLLGLSIAMSPALSLTAEPLIPAEVYPSFGLVSDVSETSWGAYIITVSDFENISYAYYAEDGDLEKGDGMALLMYDNGTPNYVLDDVVAEARYVGHIDYWTNMLPYENICEELVSE